MNIWSSNPNISDIADFRKNNMEEKSFLSQFVDDDWVVADLRGKTRKDGFAWGRFGSNQLTKRHPSELIWVIQKKKKGLLSKLFGK